MDNLESVFDKGSRPRIILLGNWRKDLPPVSYEFWIPALFISLACGALLLDFDPGDDPSVCDDEDDPLGLASARIGDEDLAEAQTDLTAANSPDAPDDHS